MRFTVCFVCFSQPSQPENIQPRKDGGPIFQAIFQKLFALFALFALASQANLRIYSLEKMGGPIFQAIFQKISIFFFNLHFTVLTQRKNENAGCFFVSPPSKK